MAQVAQTWGTRVFPFPKEGASQGLTVCSTLVNITSALKPNCTEFNFEVDGLNCNLGICIMVL